MQRHALTDAQWARLQPLLPRRAQGRQAARGDRLFVDAVIFRARTGIQWRDLPERFGKWKSVYNRFRNWAVKDVWAQVFRELRIDVDDTASIVDGATLLLSSWRRLRVRMSSHEVMGCCRSQGN
jgi:transposase